MVRELMSSARATRIPHDRAARAVLRATTAIIALISIVALAGCAGTPAVTDTDLRLEAARHAFGGRFEYFVVEPASPLADSAMMQAASIAGRSPLAEDLAARFAPATARSVRILVTGARAEKTLQVIEQAFALTQGVRLEGLELLFLGVPRHEPEVRRLAEAASARMRFAAFEE